MDTWLKSILVGFVFAILAFFSSKGFLSPKLPSKFRVEYLIKTDPVDKFHVIGRLLEKRFQAGDYEYNITETNDRLLAIAIRNVIDTLFLRDIIVTTNRVQFREMYTLEEPALQSMLLSADTVTKEMFPEKVQKKDTTSQINEHLSKEVRDLLLSMDSAEQKDKKTGSGFFSLVEIVSPYTDTSGIVNYPASIGLVWPKNTALVKNILRSPKVMKAWPNDILFYFGPGEGNPYNSKKERHNLYAIRTFGRPEKAMLENEDIKNARTDYDINGRPEVVLEFNNAGSIKWQKLTERNIGHPIAIIVNNSVISAPNVMSAIMEGKAVITGDFTLGECMKISTLLNGGIFPATINIISSRITSEKPVGKLSPVWITLIAFILGVSLSFFIFKTLKAT